MSPQQTAIFFSGLWNASDSLWSVQDGMRKQAGTNFLFSFYIPTHDNQCVCPSVRAHEWACIGYFFYTIPFIP